MIRLSALLDRQGNFELNVFKPVIIYNVIQSIYLLSDACRSFTEHCVEWIEANKEIIQYYLNHSLMLVTALNPILVMIKQPKSRKKPTPKAAVCAKPLLALGYLTGEEFDKIVQPEKMI